MEIDSPKPINSFEASTRVQPIQDPEKNHRGFFPIILGVIVLLVVVASSAYYLGTQKNRPTEVNPEQNSSVSPTITSSPAASSISPKIVAFMRNGEIWLKDLSTNKASKISKTAAVQSPKLSPLGNYVTYHPIVHAGGGFPRGNLYLTDKNGTTETILGEAAALGPETSRLTWSDDEKFVGFVLFQNTGEAKIYDIVEKKVILEKAVNSVPNNSRTLNKSYNVNLDCNTLVTKYQAICTQFQTVLNQDLTQSATADKWYKWEDLLKSKYTKPNYKLTRSQKLDNGLVVLEYYTGEPQNPEAQWGEGGGIFIPGYDKGVTETYTILLDEQSDKVILELPRAVDSDFLF